MSTTNTVYKHLVILDNEKKIKTVYEGKYTVKSETKKLTITFTNEPEKIYSTMEWELNKVCFLLLIDDKETLQEVYEGSLSALTDTVITISAVPVKGIITKVVGQNNLENNNKLCETFGQINNLIKGLTGVEQELICIEYNGSNNNYYVNIIALIDQFDILVKRIIYDDRLIKLISMTEEKLSEIKDFYDSNNENQKINLGGTNKLIQSIIQFNPSSPPSVDDINKILESTITDITPYDIKGEKQLLNVNGRYILDFIQNLFILKQNLCKNYKNKKDEKALEFLNPISVFVVNNIGSYVNTLTNLYTINGASHEITEFIRLLKDKVVSSEIDAKYIEDSNSRLITYIKINNTESNSVIEALDSGNTKYYKYNERFNILLGDTRTSMIVQYNSHPVKYYDNSNMGNNSLKSFAADIIDSDYYKKNEKVALFDVKSGEIKKYDYTYTYGHFSNIFTPDYDNKTVSSKMKEVLNSLDSNDPKPVFIIGYGSSGAGKTSSLIYFNKGEGAQKDGVLIWLLKNLCATKRYNTVEFYIKEFDVNHKDEPVRTPDDTDKIKYNYVDGQFKLDTTNLDKIQEVISGDKRRNKYRTTDRTGTPYMIIETQSDLSEKPKLDYTPEPIVENTDIGDILIRLIDTNRFVKATTNNPNSSRSHVVVYVKLTNSNNNNSNPGYLYIGDFAGVENKFGCNVFVNVQRFLDIPRDNEKQNDGETPMTIPTRYYNTEPNNIADDDKYIFGGAHDMTLGLNFEFVNLKQKEIDRKQSVVNKIDFDSDINTNDFHFVLSSENMFNLVCKNMTLFLFYYDILLLKATEEEINDFVNSNEGEGVRTNPTVVTNLTKIQNGNNNDYKSKLSDLSGVYILAKEISEKNKELDVLKTELNKIPVSNNKKPVSNNKNPPNPYIAYITQFVNDLLKVKDNKINSEVNVKIQFDESGKSIKHILTPNDTNTETNRNLLINNILGLTLTDTDIKKTCPNSVCNMEFSSDRVNIKEIRDGLIKYLSKPDNSNATSTFTTNLKGYTRASESYTGMFKFVIDRTDIEFKELNHESTVKIQFRTDASYNIDYILGFTEGEIKNRAVPRKTYTIFIKEVNITLPKMTDSIEPIENLLNQHTNKYLSEAHTKITEKVNSLSNVIVPKLATLNTQYKLLVDMYNHVKSVYKTLKYEFFNDTIVSNTKITLENIGITTPVIQKVKEFVFFFIGSDISTLSPNFNELMDVIYKKYVAGLEACINREKEGDYINSSLSDIRKTIDEMMAVKNGDRIVVPAFIYDCYKSYCPTGIDCFTSPKISSTKDIPSPIFKSIYEDMDSNDSKDSKPIDVFYKDLLVCLFCVFNIARAANNPPTSRYIDANELKYFLKTGGKTFVLKEEPATGQDVMKNFHSVIDRIEKNIFNIAEAVPWKDPAENTVGDTGDTSLSQTKIESKETQRVKQESKPELDKSRQKQKLANSDAENLLHIIENNQKIYIKDHINVNAVENKINTFDAIANYVIDKIKIIEKIDKYNAASTIGTLDYADRFAKMNLVNNTCTTYNTPKIVGGDLIEGYRELEHEEYYAN